jgi:competence protein ComEC
MGGHPGVSNQNRPGTFARRPAIGAAACLITGILLHSTLPHRPELWLTVAASGAGAALLAYRWGAIATPLLALAIAFLGLSVAQQEHFRFPADHIVTYTTDTPRLAEIELTLDQPPRVLTQSSPGGRPLPPRQVAAGRVNRVKTWNGWVNASGEMLLQLTPPRDDLAYGQRVVALGTLSRPAPAMNPGEFDWARYYREQRILVSLDVPQSENVRVLAAPGFTPLHWLRQRARTALAKGFTRAQSVDHALLRALLLGDNDPQLRDIQADFVKTGTSHHLSISGMHVAVLGAVVFFFCRLVRLSPRVAACVMMGFVLLYGLVALPAPPVIRSIILCLTFGVGVIFRRAVDGVQLLAFTLFVMLLAYPLDLYNAGFQLSFGTELGLMLYATKLTKLLDRQDEDERVLMASGVPPTRAKSIRNWLRAWLIEGVATGLVAWAISAPLIVEHFDQLNPWSIPAGILLAIPVFASMIGGLVKVVLTLVLPWFAPGWAWLAALPVEVMRHGVGWLAKIPGSDVALPAVPIVLVVIYYALLLLPLIPTAKTRVKWLFRSGAATACVGALMLPLLIGFAPQRGGGELKVTLLSVGAGQCAVVELPTGKTLLIDAGSSSISDLQRRTLDPFLRHEGSRSVDCIYVSHANFDHFSAVAQAVEDYGVHKVVITPQFLRDARKNFPARKMLQRLRELKCPVEATAAGQNTDLGDGCSLEVLWPPPDGRLDANNSCQVMRLSYRGRTILFTGDIQARAESGLMSDDQKLKADILIAPHHGSAEETTAKLVEAVAPCTILASNDRTLSGKQREFDKLTADRQFLRTHDCGAITVTISNKGTLTVTTFLKPPAVRADPP